MRVLNDADDDCIAIQTLHMNALGLLPKGFQKKRIEKLLSTSDLDRQHWLLAYESVRHGFLSSCATIIAHNPLFASMMKKKVTFYRTTIPRYSMAVHPGGPPEWMVRSWMQKIADLVSDANDSSTRFPIIELIADDLARLRRDNLSSESTLLYLVDNPDAAASVSESSIYSLG